MKKNRNTQRFGDLCRVNTQTYSLCSNWDVFYYLDTGNITENVVSDIQHIVTSKGDKLPSRARRLVKKGDILFSTVRPNQRHYGYLKNVIPHFLVSTGFCVISPKENVDGKFIYYFLTQTSVIDKLQAIAEQSTSTYPSIRAEDIANLQINVPSLEEQQKISSILSSLDDKIEVNNQINRNLEEQIQALYRFYFEENEKETIIRGKLKDICVYVTEKTSVSELTLDNYFSTENLMTDKRGATKASGLPQIALTTKCVSGNILVSNIRPYFKKLLFCDKMGGCSTDVLCFQAKTPQLTNFLYSTLYFDAFFDHMTAGSKGTKMPRGDKTQIMEYPIPIPAPDLLAAFNQQVTPMIKLCQKCKQENTILSQTRDTLLPKLMSGEITLS